MVGFIRPNASFKLPSRGFTVPQQKQFVAPPPPRKVARPAPKVYQAPPPKRAFPSLVPPKAARKVTAPPVFNVRRPTTLVARANTYHASRDYQMRYAREQMMSRKLASENRMLKGQLAKMKKEHTAQMADYRAKIDSYEDSGVYAANSAAKSFQTQVAKATNLITPSVNGIHGFPEVSEPTSRLLAGAIGAIAILMIIGRVE